MIDDDDWWLMMMIDDDDDDDDDTPIIKLLCFKNPLNYFPKDRHPYP